MRPTIAFILAAVFAGTAWAAQPPGDGGKEKPAVGQKEESGVNTRSVLKEVEVICATHSDLHTAQESMGKKMASLGTVRHEEIPLLVGEASNTSKDWKYRLFVLRVLADIKDSRITAQAIRALNDEKAEMRVVAAYALGRSSDTAAVEPLAGHLDDSDRHVRIAVAKSLGQLKDRKAIGPLISRLRAEKDFVVKVNLVEGGLGAFQDNAVSAQLILSLSDPHPDVRASAARFLGAYSHPEVAGALANALRKDEHPLVRFYAAQSLGNQVGGGTAAEVLAEAEKKENQDFVLRAIRAARARLSWRPK